MSRNNTEYKKNEGQLVFTSVLVFFMLISALGVACAKDLYVSPNGSDSNSYAVNDINHPWASPMRAWGGPGISTAECARAGDTVYFRAGTYSISQTIDTKFFGNTGTSQAPITFRNFPKERAFFDGGQLGWVISIQKDWNIIDGINFIGGLSVLVFGNDLTVNGGIVKNCSSIRALGGDNTGFVKVSSTASGINIINCKIVGPGLMSNGIHQNTSGIIAFNSPGLVIKNCEISNSPIGVYFKFGNKLTYGTGIDISHNYIHDTDRYCVELNASYASVTNNIFKSPAGPFRINEDNGGAGGDYNTISHNTFINTAFILSMDAGGALYNKITNNIFTGQIYLHRYSVLPHYSQMDYNLYSTKINILEFSTNYTPQQWTAKNNETHSYVGLPNFADQTIFPQVNRYALVSGLGKNGASDLLDVGASITDCGLVLPKAPFLTR